MKMLIILVGLLLNSVVLAMESPISLTSSEGAGLEFHQLEVRVVLDGFLAFTELQMVFYNPENRQREGRLQMVLPNNAAISRFAMKIGEQLQEGEIVEKQFARQAYEDFLQRRQDPALLEIDSGNRFNARIFPIAPHAEKLLILSYSQRLENDYILPLKGLPLLKRFTMKISYDKKNFGTPLQAPLRENLTIEKADYQPLEDFRMPYQSPFASTKVVKGMVMQNDQWLAARVIPFEESEKARQDFEVLVMLVDTSASQAPLLPATINRLTNLLAQLKVNTLLLYTFDQASKAVGQATTLAEQQALIQQLNQIDALGASRLDSPLAKLSKLKLARARLLLISDMVVTAGDSIHLFEQLQSNLPWLERVDIIIPSTYGDQRLAHRLVRAGKSAGSVNTWQSNDTQLLDRLTHASYTELPITVTGARWYWPAKVEMLSSQEPVFIFAELEEPSSFSISVGNRPIPVTLQTGNPLLLKREWARGQIERLLELEENSQDFPKKDNFRNEIIKLSINERVLSPYTSLLILETEADYHRYHINRRGLADILTVGMEGLTVIKRLPLETKMLKKEVPELSQERSEAPLEAPRVSPPPAGGAELATRSEAVPQLNPDDNNPPANSFSVPVRPRTVPMFRRDEQLRDSTPSSKEEQIELSPWSGQYAEFRTLLAKNDLKGAGKLAQQWHQQNLADVMALIALGEWYEKSGELAQAARSYGSLIDYFPARADIRRWAGERLLASKIEYGLAIDTFKKAVESRPDHPSGHYLLAMAYWEAGHHKEAVRVLEEALEINFEEGHFRAVKRILQETLSLMLTKVNSPQLRVVLMWETDANDVDLHIYDGLQQHAYYSSPTLPTGGSLYADITSGYGPECFQISTPTAFPYKIQAHYYNKGPMGYGMGMVHILKYVPKEGVKSEFRPFVVMQDQAFVDLGSIEGQGVSSLENQDK